MATQVIFASKFELIHSYLFRTTKCDLGLIFNGFIVK
jgi:hypothetical protein